MSEDPQNSAPDDSNSGDETSADTASSADNARPAVTFLSPDTPDTPSSSGSLSLLMQPNVNLEEVSFKEKVGHGSYGVVYKAVWGNRYVAVKELDATAEQKTIETEVKQLSRVSHPNIIALFGISANKQSKYLIMEYAEGGSLHNFLHGKVKPVYSKAHAISWARQCADGVAYLHDMKPKPLIHRDLKPLNLLLTNKGRHLKICDFGTVADKCTLMTNNKGSAAWMAPEVFEGSKYTEKCDIFSWAIVLWEVLSRQQPFKDNDNAYSIMWKIHLGERPPMIEDCAEPIQQLMTSCWATLPDSRPSMQHVLKVMNELADQFPGADEPLEYEFVNQQIICSNTIETASSFTASITTSSSTTSSSTQITPTNSNTNSNTSSSLTPTASGPEFSSVSNITSQVPIGSIIASTTRWDVIPEESEAMYSVKASSDNIFNLTPSAEASKRYETIRNEMSRNANDNLAPLNLDVDSACWELPGGASAIASSGAKSDGKERLTVTEAKPMLTSTTTTTTGPTTITAPGQGPIDNSNSSSDVVDDEDDDENDGTEQSLHEMLDPELQPEKPIPNNRESQQLYREHRRLAREYLQVETKLYYAQDLKEKLLTQIDPVERQEKLELLKKINERDELLELYNNLKQQQERMIAQQQQQQQYQPLPYNSQDAANTSDGTSQDLLADDWEIITSNQNA